MRGTLLLRLLAGAAVAAVFVGLQWSARVSLEPGVDKLAHGALYFLAAMAVWPRVPATDGLVRGGVVAAAGLLVAILMEQGQKGLPRRSADDLDVLADLAGLVVACVAMGWGARHAPQAGPRARLP
jgi:VanZ family protein